MKTNLRVLIIDDNVDQLEISRITLRKRDPALDIEVALDAESGLQILKEKHIDVILLDYNLPDMNGLEVLRAMQQFKRDIPVIFVTGQGNEKIAVEAMKNGAADYIIKEGDYLKLLAKTVRHAHEKARLKKQILTSKLRLQALFDGIQDFISVQDRDFNIIMVNRSFAEWKNTQPDLLVGKKCYELYFNRNRPCDNCPMVRTFDSGEKGFYEMRYQQDTLHIWSYPMANPEGDLEYAIEHIRVVTEQKRMEEQLIQNDKLVTIGILSSGIAHELRNPLNIIEAARYFLAESIPPEEKQLHEKLAIIRKNVHRASKIINNLLEFSRKHDEDREEVDVHYILESTLALVEKEMRVRDIEVHREYSAGLIGYFDVDGLRQIFLNLIMNAMQAMPEGGHLYIRANIENDEVLNIEFEDTGVGISPENLRNIFAPFFTTKPVGEGTGLGLYIVNAIVHRNNGEIDVQSEPGKGTVFRVRLPFTRTPDAAGNRLSRQEKAVPCTL